MKRSLLLGLGVAAALLVASCGDESTTSPANSNAYGSKDTSAPRETTVDTAANIGGGGLGTVPGTVALEGECANADGSSPKTTQFAAYPAMCIDAAKTYVATVNFGQGTLHIELRPDIAPLTVNSFVNLARFHYFDGTTCHRAIQNFVVQCGDPTATGTGGPGYEFQDELDKIEPYRIGSVAMANAGPNTNGSQFFIITGDDGASLPPNYTLFGQVIDDDLGIVAALDKVSNPGDGPPLEPIDITSVVIDEKS